MLIRGYDNRLISWAAVRELIKRIYLRSLRTIDASKHNIFRFIVRKIFRVKVGQMIPFYAQWLRYIMFPLWCIRNLKNHVIYYAPEWDCFYIYGQRYDAKMFWLLSRYALKDDTLFKFSKSGCGTIYIEEVSWVSEDEIKKVGE